MCMISLSLSIFILSREKKGRINPPLSSKGKYAFTADEPESFYPLAFWFLSRRPFRLFCRFCPRKSGKALAVFLAATKPRVITIQATTRRRRRRPAKPACSGRAAPPPTRGTAAAAALSVWPRRRSSGSPTETTPLTRGTPSPATTRSASRRTARSEETATGNLNKYIDLMRERLGASSLKRSENCVGRRGPVTLGCRVNVARSPKTSRCSQRRRKSSGRRKKTRPSSSRSRSRSRSRSSGSSRYSGRYSRSLSPSSCKWVHRADVYITDIQ